MVGSLRCAAVGVLMGGGEDRVAGALGAGVCSGALRAGYRIGAILEARMRTASSRSRLVRRKVVWIRRAARR